jgi:hypothetical protein
MITHDELIGWLQKRSVERLEWTVFFNNDEAAFGPGMVRLADGTTQAFNYSLGDKAIDNKLWDISSRVWTSDMFGLYVLDVAERIIKRTARVYTEWDVSENKVYNELFPDQAVQLPNPTDRLYGNSDLLFLPLDPDQQDTIALDDLPNT